MSIAFKKSVLLMSLLALTGCESLNNLVGSLSLTAPQKFVTNGGNVKTLPAGRYKMTLKMGKDKSTAFITKGLESIQFDVPTALANSYGDFRIPANKLKQAFGLAGSIESVDREYSTTYSEQCVKYTTSEYLCQPLRPGQQHQDCAWVETPVYGSQSVYEEGIRTTKIADVDLIGASGKAVGNFYATYEVGTSVHRREITSACW